MIRSMTAFATQQGNADPSGTAATWTWEVRSVNGRGMDVKVRLPDSAAGLEGDVRAQVAKVATRGNITIGLRLNTATADGSLQIDPARLDVILDALDTIQERAFDKGVTLAQPTAAAVLWPTRKTGLMDPTCVKFWSETIFPRPKAMTGLLKGHVYS